ncbi:MAG: hypothetical protein ACQRW7_00935 [Caulobacterales bacterium]|uniref:hypothetical protein n=1 Tax=Glycocaulis sp. TaxID=1969725 RepID=UPI003F9FBBF7
MADTGTRASRRAFLTKGLAGAGMVTIAGTAAAGWRIVDAGVFPADTSPFEPWKALGMASQGDPSALAAAAILASNPHNTQPWTFELASDRCVIEADTTRHLGAFDPYRREMWIGLGAALANAEIAAPAFGFSAGRPRLEALGANGAGRIFVPLTPAPAMQPSLFDAIPNRRTNRAPYDGEPVPEAQLAAIEALAGETDGASLEVFDRDTPRGQAFIDGTLEATAAINADAQMSHDGHVWFRGNAREIARHRDGVSVPTAGLSPVMSFMGQLLPEPDAASSGQYWLNSTRGQLGTAGGFGVITIADAYDRAGQLAAGRLWQRLHLALTHEGLAAHPLNQLPELVDRDRQLGIDRGWRERLSALTTSDGDIVFAFRYGRALRQVPRSARRPLEWVSGS